VSESGTRVLLFTGKGGVGKTSVAAATAIQCADAGLRTLVISTDPAHSLSDAFDVPLDGTERRIEGTETLYAQQLDATERLEEAWGDIQSYLTDVFNWAGVQGIEAEELSVIPGLDEIFSLSDLKSYADSGAWEVIIVDCGPTAETIRLLSLPEILGWYMDRVFPAGRRVTKLVRPVLNRVTNLPIAEDSVFESAGRFYDKLDGVRDLLADGERTTVRLVVNPERLVVAEARRTATYLGLFGYRVDAVVANRLLPDAVTDPWFKAWKEAHAEHLTEIEEGFAPLPILKAELCSEELVGVDRLRAFGQALYGDNDPKAVLHREAPLRLDGHVLKMHLPFADKDELELARRGDELIVRVGPNRRNLLLPDSLRRRAVTDAHMNGDWLEVSFGD
jgi:arsenite/tail-anchored protein-transporting ATPase